EMAITILAKRTGGSGAGFLMVPLAVDDRGDAVLGEAAYPAPDFHDVAASGIHHVAAGFLDLLHEVRGSAESGDDDDIILGESVIFRAHVLPRQGNDPHIPQLAVYLGVVDDLADQENPVVRKHAA